MNNVKTIFLFLSCFLSFTSEAAFDKPLNDFSILEGFDNAPFQPDFNTIPMDSTVLNLEQALLQQDLPELTVPLDEAITNAPLLATKEADQLLLPIQRQNVSNQKAFECTICKKKFSLKKNLKRHQLVHSNQKSFTCTTCQKTFSLQGFLNRHQQIHVSEKPFECTICKKRFSEKGNLKKHYLIHSGEKPFQCTICGKSFLRRSGLTMHQSSHTGEYPFKCTLCNKGFSKASGVKRHLLTHTCKQLNE